MILSHNKDKIQEYSLRGYKKRGVSIDDLVKLPGINRAAIFTYMDYSEPELKRYFRLLIKRSPPILKALQEHDNEVSKRYVIVNKDLQVFIMKCWTMFYTVLSRMRATWTYIREPKRNSGEVDWFLTFFGVKMTEKLVKTIEKKCNFISHIYDEVKRNDINIIASYKQLLSGSYEHIRKKYRLIVNPLLEACYPDFIRILHKKNEI
jgi:hypothetical protein